METRRCKVRKKETQANDTCKQWTLAKNAYIVTSERYMVCLTCANWKKEVTWHTKDTIFTK